MKNIEMKHAKRLALGVLTVVVFGAGASATKVSAQNASVFEVQVPFNFVVMGRTYEAARYRIGRLDQSNPDTLVLNSSTGKTLLIIHTRRINSGEPAESSMLTFSRHGDTNFLDSIRASGASYVSRIPTVKSDRRRRSIAQASQTVSLKVKQS